MSTIVWNGETVTRVFTAYQSRAETPVSGGKFGHTYTLPAEYAVKDQSGLIAERFSTMAEAEAYAARRNPPVGLTSTAPIPYGERRWNGSIWPTVQVDAYNRELARIASRHAVGFDVQHLVDGLYNLAAGFDAASAPREGIRYETTATLTVGMIVHADIAARVEWLGEPDQFGERSVKLIDGNGETEWRYQVPGHVRWTTFPEWTAEDWAAYRAL